MYSQSIPITKWTIPVSHCRLDPIQLPPALAGGHKMQDLIGFSHNTVLKVWLKALMTNSIFIHWLSQWQLKVIANKEVWINLSKLGGESLQFTKVFTN